jgi:hypothetical protein
MGNNTFRCPPASPSGLGTFSNNLVGFQLVNGGGLTQGNFEFSTSITEKVNRRFNIGAFSNPISLEDLDVNNIEQAKILASKNFGVFPNYDLSEVTNFTLYGSLQKRLSTSVIKIINYYPAAIEVDNLFYDFTSGNTAININYDSIEDTTTFDIDVKRFKNPFDIDYSVNSSRNISVRPFKVSPLRNLTVEYLKYALYVDNIEEEFKFVDFEPSLLLSEGIVTISVEGNPFPNQTTTTSSIILKPNKLQTEIAFQEPFDEVEIFLLNRDVVPKYTASFELIKENNSGVFVKETQSVTWPLDGTWNLDIRTENFDEYLEDLNKISEVLDLTKTNLIVRFLTTGAFIEFDTDDQKIQKVLQIYGRAFDETKKFIDGLAHINSVNYNTGNDIPSALLKNLAETLGWSSNISPITNEGFLNSIFGTKNDSIYSGQAKDKTPDEINFQFYQNLILNSAYLFKSKGTRKAIEALLRLVGAPKALIEFNEIIYLADGPINLRRFEEEFVLISGGTKSEFLPVLNPQDTFTIFTVPYTGFQNSVFFTEVDTFREDYPIDSKGFPRAITPTDDYYFEKGSGWFEQTTSHRSPEILNVTDSVFTGQTPNIQTELEVFTYGQKYFDRFRNFPFMNLGFQLTKTFDNKKSWTDNEIGNRKSSNGDFNADYLVTNEKLVLNAKNIEIYLNVGQGALYDIWDMSRKFNYPFPSSGLTTPYPSPGGIDWTVINPKPNEKTFFEFAQSFYKNMINVRNRQTFSDARNNGYPTLQSIYRKYLESEETVGIPSNKYTYQKMIDFIDGIGDYWIRLLEQFVPASTIWTAGQKMENTIFDRQKFVWRRQRDCQLIPVECIPCQFNGQVLKYDCIDQTIECEVGLPPMSKILSSTLNLCVSKSGYTINDCILNSLTSQWFVDIRLDDDILVQEPFYIGYGISDYPTENQWLESITSGLTNIFQEGLDYTLENNILSISNSGCEDNFTNKKIKVSVGVDINITCN